MSENRIVLVIGATGRQGGAVARELLRQGWKVRALTRSPTSAAALALASAGATLTAGDLRRPDSLVQAMRGAFGVFAVTDFWEHGFRTEVESGRALIDAAAAAGVQHFVFSSVGGTDRTRGLGIRHFDSKREIENYLAASPLFWTVFRPVTFFENFVSPRYLKAIRRGVFRFTIRPDLPFQMVAMTDLAEFVARALAAPERFARQSIEIASDRFTMVDFAETLSRATGRRVRYQYLPRPLQVLIGQYVSVTASSGHYKIGPSLVTQFDWNNSDPQGGWRADIDRLRALQPLTSKEKWAASYFA